MIDRTSKAAISHLKAALRHIEKARTARLTDRVDEMVKMIPERLRSAIRSGEIENERKP